MSHSDSLITARETRRRLGGISAMTEWRWRKARILPPPVVLNGRKYDRESDINELVDRLLSERGKAA